MGKDQNEADDDEPAKLGSTLCHDSDEKARSVPELVRLTMQKAAWCYTCETRGACAKSGTGRIFYLLKSRLSRTACSSRLFFTEVYAMDMMGRVGLVEIPILIAPDQKVWMDRMIKEGKIAIPPGGTLEKGSLYSMFVRMLLHNAMEEQKRQEALDAEDEDDE
jgi:hypothetical protein